MSSHPPTARTSVRLDELIDHQPVGGFHYLLLAMTGAVMFLDGLDTQAISFIAPVIARQWHLPVTALGPIFSASIAGLMVGYLVLAPMATRFGHRRLVISSTALFGVFTVLCAFVDNETQLLVLRLLTGMGLGTAIPSAIALAGEFAPARRRSTFVMFIYCWLALGFVAASLLSGVVIPAWGWRTVFVIGGALPLLLVVALRRYLPESPTYLVLRGANDSRIHAILRRLDPRLDPAARVVLAAKPAEASRSPLVEVFRRHWLPSTLLLWSAFTLNLAVFYAVQSWLPTVLGRLGHTASTAVGATALTTIGGIAAAMLIGPAMDKRGPFKTLGVVYLAGAALIAVLAFALTGGSTGLLVAAFLAGTCVTGGQMSVIALATVLYPPQTRSTGVSWALGVGRIGGIVGPLLVGLALGAGVAARSVFLIMAGAFVVAGVVVFLLDKTSRPVRTRP